MKKIVWILWVSVLMTACGESKEKTEEKETSEEKTEEKELNTETDGENKGTVMSAEDYMNQLELISKGVNDQTANDIYSLTLEFEKNHSGDHNVAKALFRSARILNDHAIADVSKPDGVVKRGISLKALDLLNLLFDKYPEDNYTQRALELKVGILDGNLRMKKEAVATYEELLKTYPSDTVNAEIYKDRIANIDKDPYAFLKNL
jgi:tetratricopeptide (TPR) repeat protein